MRRFAIIMLSFVSLFMPVATHAASAFDQQAAVYDTTLYDPKDYGTCGAPGGSSTGSTTSLAGNDNAEKIFTFLTGKGLSAAQAAGIMGNFQQESGFDPAIIQGGTIASPDYIPVDGVGFGIAQWTFSARQIPLEDLARNTNRKITDLSLQLDYLWQELSGPYGNALTSLKAETTPEQAAFVFHRDYEGSADSLQTVIQVRGGNARTLYEKYKNLAPSSASAPSAPSATSSSTSGCSNSGSSSGTGTGGGGNFLGNNFIIYNQCQYPPFGGPWGTRTNPYGYTACSSACTPTALAMVAANMTGNKVTPDDTFTSFTNHNEWYPSGGSLLTAPLDTAGDFGLNISKITDKGNLAAYQNVFSKGGLITVSAAAPSPFLSYGHTIVLRGINSSGQFVIADPGYTNTNIAPNNQFSTDAILTDIRSDPMSAVYAYYKK